MAVLKVSSAWTRQQASRETWPSVADGRPCGPRAWTHTWMYSDEMFYLYHTSCSAVSLSKCFKLKFSSKAFVSALQRRSGGERGEAKDTGSPVSCSLGPEENRPHLSPAPPPSFPLLLLPPQDGVAIFWSLLRQRWNRSACLKCTQMQFDLSSIEWEAQLGTAAPFLTPFAQNSAWKGGKKI